MARLLHFALDPFCRLTRLALGEYGTTAELLEERPWEQRAEFLALNPAGLLPVLIDDNGAVAAGIEAVSEHLEENAAPEGRSLLGRDPAARAETRRLVAWFNAKYHHEVGGPVLTEKVVKRFMSREAGGGPPNMARVRAALGRIRGHLAYIAELAESRSWLAGDNLSLADLAAAAH